MKYAVAINSIKTINELENSWTNSDYIELLKRFDYPDADKLSQNELKEYLFMAITDFDPNEAAAIVLNYKLSEVLAEGQILNLSHEMLREKVSENYSDISLHKSLFNINQLLYKAYNGKFQSAKATIIEFEMKEQEDDQTEITKEMVLKSIKTSLSDNNLLKRLFNDQLEGKTSFPEAEAIIWDFQNKGNAQYSITTSEKWLTKENFSKMEFECTVRPFIAKSEEV